MEMVKMQEESFVKMQSEISSLQNKIKGLEHKLGPSNSGNISGVLNNQKRSNNESYNSMRNRQESRILKYEDNDMVRAGNNNSWIIRE
jgi:pyocin large subunit-like protein